MIVFPKPAVHVGRVAANQRIAAKISQITLTLETGHELPFIAGQYNSYILAPTVRRTYSISTPPHDLPAFSFCTDTTPEGEGARWVRNLKPGDHVDFLGPLGRFVVDAMSPRKKVFVATGTGISPIRAMITDLLSREAQAGVSLYWGLRYPEDIFWDDYFLEQSARFRNFSYTLTLSQPSGGWRRHIGRVNEHVFVMEQTVSDCDFYLCGNRTMVLEMMAQLKARGVPEVQLKTELFY